ncbi:MAG TPA: leucine--tRNA ligase [Patescibacteria group bacterium]|nr:leucine--tRNA ligase [Patescibacteria group bacterium]
MAYNHQEIEKKWQDRWETSGVFHAKDGSEKQKFYCLIEFPYPSGAGLHIGHPRSYTALDVVSRKRRHQGYNVLYPIGWDAFGLPTENYAIKTGRKPQDITRENTDTFRRQLKSLGLSFDWSREVNTTDPAYYKWTQWMFIEFFKAGLAYKTKQPINWCLSCKIGLANEEVVNGKCERCGGPTEKRDKEQWMIAITKYADRLLEDLDTVDYMEKIKVQQRNWIGKSEGAEIDFPVPLLFKEGLGVVSVFTTRPDTIFGATFLVVSPEVAQKWIEVGWDASASVREYVTASLKREEMDRTAEGKEKTGVDTGVVAMNPANGKQIPVWIADFVLGHYGTGAVFADAHDQRDFDFAKKYNIPLKVTIKPDDAELWKKVKNLEECYEGDGEHFDSEFLNGLRVKEAVEKVIDWIETKGVGRRTIQYKLRDWVFSRQRYWGEPIPLVHCEKCSPETGGWVAVPVEQLPVVLPDVEKYEPTDTGESPLAAMTDWVNTTCPTCGGPARRETDTMPNWAGSSWYFLRYIDAHNDKEFASQEKLKYWMPIDLYNGGMEHTVLHLLYSRFWNKFLFDRGHVPTSEPYARRHSHGLVLAEDGTKMSKSKGNVVNPDEIVRDYGADSLRMYILFMGPFEEPVPWSLNGLIGVRRFLDKVERYVGDWSEPSVDPGFSLGKAGVIERALKKVSDDIESFKFNTAVSAFMSLFNEIVENYVTREQLKKILVVLGPFAPHLANECWEKIGEKGMVEEQAWPEFDARLLVQEEIEMGVQVNGKARATIQISPTADEATAKQLAFADEKVQKHLEGKEIVKIVYVPGRILNIVIK